MNKEQVYDSQVEPLMAKIIGICQEHGIAMLCTFAIPTPEDDGLQCTSLLPDETGDNPAHHKAALRSLKGEPSFVAMTITPGVKEDDRG